MRRRKRPALWNQDRHRPTDAAFSLNLPTFRFRASRRLRGSVAGPVALAGLATSAIVALLAGLGPTKSIAAVFGLLLTAAMLEWPIIGLVLVVLSGTCFQIMGGEAITGLPLSLGKLFGILTLGMWLLKFLRDRIPFTYSPQMLALLAYFIAMLIVGVLVHPTQPAVENGIMRFFQAFVVFWLMANLAGTDRRALLIGCGSITGGMAICGIIGTLEHFVPSFAIESDDPALKFGAIGAVLDHDSLQGVSLRRITGGLGDSNWLADSVVAAMPLNLFWWWISRGFLAKSLVIAVSALQFLALILSYTRAGFLGLGVAVLFLVWRRVISVRLLAWGSVAAILVALVWLPPGFMDRVFSVKYLEEGSTPMRKDLTGTALLFALERPILGYGYGQFGIEFISRVNTDLSNRIGAWGFELVRAVEEGRELAQDVGAHNLYLEILVEYGLLGLIPFLAFMGLMLYDLRCAERWGNEEQRLLAICIAAGLIGFFVSGMFVHAKYLKILWFMAGLAAAQRRVVLTTSWHVVGAPHGDKPDDPVAAEPADGRPPPPAGSRS